MLKLRTASLHVCECVWERERDREKGREGGVSVRERKRDNECERERRKRERVRGWERERQREIVRHEWRSVWHRFDSAMLMSDHTLLLYCWFCYCYYSTATLLHYCPATLLLCYCCCYFYYRCCHWHPSFKGLDRLRKLPIVVLA